MGLYHHTRTYIRVFYYPSPKSNYHHRAVERGYPLSLANFRFRFRFRFRVLNCHYYFRRIPKNLKMSSSPIKKRDINSGRLNWLYMKNIFVMYIRRKW